MNRIAQFLQLSLFSAVLVLAESVFGQLVSYCFGEPIGPLYGPGFYLALSAGSFLAFKSGNTKPGPHLFLIAAALCLLSGAGFCYLPELSILWAVLPFLAFGYILNSFYMTCSLRELLFAGSVGVLSMILALKFFTHESDARYYPLGIIVALSLCGFLDRPKIGKCLALILVAAISTFGFTEGYLKPSAGMIRDMPMLKNGALMHPTIMTPWIYTDLVQTKPGPVIITNGSRFSQVVKGPKMPHAWVNKPVRYMDEAFIVSAARSALIIGPAGGVNVGRALKYNVDDIDAVDINPAVFELMSNDLRDYSGSAYLDPRVHMIVSEGRHFMETTQKKYDLIFVQGVRTGTNASTMDGSLFESYILTPESVQTMWDHLTDGGVILLEDFFLPAVAGDPNSSYLKNLERQLLHKLPITDPAKQTLYYKKSNTTDGNPDSVFYLHQDNEVLLLSKQPILNPDAAENAAAGQKVELRFIPLQDQQSIFPLPITDDHPFHLERFVLKIFFVTLAFAVLGILVSGFLFTQKFKGFKNRNGFMFSAGIGYILIFMSLLGKANMILGHPQLSAAVILFSFYLFSLPTGIWATKAKFTRTLWAMVGATIWAAATFILFRCFQTDFLRITSQTEQIALLAGLVAPFAALMEIPYIAILAEADPKDRGEQFTVGKLGVAFGILLGLCLQMLFGYSTVFIAGIFFLALCVLCYRGEKQAVQ